MYLWLWTNGWTNRPGQSERVLLEATWYSCLDGGRLDATTDTLGMPIRNDDGGIHSNCRQQRTTWISGQCIIGVAWPPSGPVAEDQPSSVGWSVYAYVIRRDQYTGNDCVIHQPRRRDKETVAPFMMAHASTARRLRSVLSSNADDDTIHAWQLAQPSF